MNDIKERAEDLGDHIGDYAETFYKLTLIKLTQKITNIASGLFVGIAVFLFSLLIILFGSIALSLWIGTLLENTACGFLVVAGIYLFLLIILLLLRKKVIFTSLRNLITRKIYD